MLQPLHHFHGPSLDLLQNVHGQPSMGTPVVFHQYWAEGKNDPPQPPAPSLAEDTAQHKEPARAHFHPLLCLWLLRSLCRAASQLVIPSLSCAWGCSSLGSGLWHLPLLSFMRFLPAHFSSLSSFLWMADLPCSSSTAPASQANHVSVLVLRKTHSLKPHPEKNTKPRKQTKPTNQPTPLHTSQYCVLPVNTYLEGKPLNEMDYIQKLPRVHDTSNLTPSPEDGWRPSIATTSNEWEYVLKQHQSADHWLCLCHALISWESVQLGQGAASTSVWALCPLLASWWRSSVGLC